MGGGIPGRTYLYPSSCRLAEDEGIKMLNIWKWIWGQGKGKREPPNAMLVVERLKKRMFRYVRPEFIPRDSFEKEYKGKWFHILGVDLKGQFWPIDSPDAVEGRMPTDLFMAQNCAEEVNEVYGISSTTLQKIGIGILVAFGIGILIVIFLMVETAGGTHP